MHLPEQTPMQQSSQTRTDSALKTQKDIQEKAAEETAEQRRRFLEGLPARELAITVLGEERVARLEKAYEESGL